MLQSTKANQMEEPGLLDKIRAVAFFLWSLLLSVPLFLGMLTFAPFVMALDRQRCVLHQCTVYHQETW